MEKEDEVIKTLKGIGRGIWALAILFLLWFIIWLYTKFISIS
jgi:hypothetical protein